MHGWFRQHEGHERLRQLFAELIGATFAARGVKVPVSGGLLEIKAMLETQFDAWREQWVAEGRAEGRAEGKVEGKAEALLFLLVERFGVVAPSWRKRIRAADLPTLESWFKRAIVARELSSVFEPPC